jgi:cytochrome c oxidase subunit 2
MELMVLTHLLPLFPEQASANAHQTDNLYFFMLSVCGTVSLVIVAFIFYFAVKYRRRSEDQLAEDVHLPAALEWTWIIIPSLFFLSFFAWGAHLYFGNAKAPEGAIEIAVTGRQWMWKFQHQDGQREINTLHVPVGKPIKLTMISEDVIHSFFVPAFRVHMDVLPKAYTTAWFEPTKPGTYHLFCSQYCGTEHANMIGSVTVLEPHEYEKWLTGAGTGSLALRGEALFNKLACNSCHSGNAEARAPYLPGIHGRTIQLTTGEVIQADENYLRESILKPGAKIAGGYENIMPGYEGQLTEEEIIQLVTYIKYLGKSYEQFDPVAPPTAPAPKPAGKNPDQTVPTGTSKPTGEPTDVPGPGGDAASPAAPQSPAPSAGAKPTVNASPKSN